MMSRERFEEYAAGRLGLPIEMIFDARNGDRYLHAFDSMNVMQPLNGWWSIWQASRAAIEVELPDVYGDKYTPSSCTMDGFDFEQYLDDLCVEIQSAGLKVKK